MKQTFNIPTGCKTVTIEEIGNTIVTTFWQEKVGFKKGDFVAGDISGDTLVSIFESYYGDGCFWAFANVYADGKLLRYAGQQIDENWCTRLATDSEKQFLLKKMHEAGFDWDAEKCEVVPYKWRPKRGEEYICPAPSLPELYFVTCWFDGNESDEHRWNNGLVFKLEEKDKAIEKAKKMLEAIKLE